MDEGEYLIRKHNLKNKHIERTINFTKHLVCSTTLQYQIFTTNNLHLEFDSYFENDMPANIKIYNCISETNIIPKVCVNLVFDYLPNTVYVDVYLHQFDNISYTHVKITIDDKVYIFERGINYMREIRVDYNYMTGQKIYHFLKMFQTVAFIVKYESNHAKLLQLINYTLSLKYKLVVIDILVFLKIMSCLLLLQDYIQKPKSVCIVM